MKTPRDRYQSDNQFKALVDIMTAYIRNCDFSPSEMREAAMLASIIYEEYRMHCNPIIVNDEMEKALRSINRYLEGNEEYLPPSQRRGSSVGHAEWCTATGEYETTGGIFCASCNRLLRNGVAGQQMTGYMGE